MTPGLLAKEQICPLFLLVGHKIFQVILSLQYQKSSKYLHQLGIIVGSITGNPFLCSGISKVLSISSIRLCMNGLMVFDINKSTLNSTEERVVDVVPADMKATQINSSKQLE